MLNQPYDGLPPGYTRTPRVGPVVQLYVRTKRWAYTLILSGVLTPHGPSEAAGAAGAAEAAEAAGAGGAGGAGGGAPGRPAARPPGDLRILDESLFDTVADPHEGSNLAYYGSHAHARYRMLQTAMREWRLEPRLQQPLNESRWQRAEWLRRKTGFRNNWWKR